jgi:16S rRNA (guanine527-N7)-methyltransferase
VTDDVLPLPGEARAALRTFEDLLREYSPRLGLVSDSDLGRIWERHILDSLRALDCLVSEDRLIADLGSGAGLPGIPIAIARPDARVVLIEPKRRRAAFLELALERLGLSNASVAAARAEEVTLAADVAVARAFGSATDVWRAVGPILKPEGRVLYFAGSSWAEVPPVSVGGATVEVCRPGRLAWEGPLVIMRPLSPTAEDG